MNSIGMWILVILLAALSLASVLLWLRSRRNLEELEQRLTELINRQQNEIAAVLDGTFGVGKQVQALARDVRDLRERQQRIEKSDPGDLPYNQAMRMVENGADADQLVESCGLSRSEAELVVLLHEKSPPVVAPLKPDSSQMTPDHTAPPGQDSTYDDIGLDDSSGHGDTEAKITEGDQSVLGLEKDEKEWQQRTEQNLLPTEDEHDTDDVSQSEKQESSSSTSIERAEQDNRS